MTKRPMQLLAVIALLTSLAGAAMAADGFDDNPSASDLVEGAIAVDDSTATTDGVDISGPCDEAEHAGDPRCAGVEVPAAGGSLTGGVDISGPCDEAEHANDPRCTGADAAAGDDSLDDDSDTSGHEVEDDDSGKVGDDDDDDDDDDDSGKGNDGDDGDHEEDDKSGRGTDD